MSKQKPITSLRVIGGTTNQPSKPHRCKKCRALEDRIQAMQTQLRIAREDVEYADMRMRNYQDHINGMYGWNILVIGIVTLGILGWVVFT